MTFQWAVDTCASSSEVTAMKRGLPDGADETFPPATPLLLLPETGPDPSDPDPCDVGPDVGVEPFCCCGCKISRKIPDVSLNESMNRGKSVECLKKRQNICRRSAES